MWRAPLRRLIHRGRYYQENRDYLSHKHENLYMTLEKVRKDYGTINFDHIHQVFSLTRKEDESLRQLRKVNRIAGVIRAREEFPEVNITHKHTDIARVNRRTLFHMGGTEPYKINIDDDEEVILCTISDLITHDSIQTWFLWMYWDRFIEGRPNRMLMKLMVEDDEKCEGVRRGGHLRIIEHYVWCDVYSTPYPRTLSCHIEDVIPGKDYTIGDLRRDLPDNVKLSPQYARSDSTNLIACDENVKTGVYESFLVGHFDATRWHDIEMTRMRVPQGDVQAAAKEQDKEKLLSSSELEHMKKLAKHLGKDFEELKSEMLKNREKEKKKPPAPLIDIETKK